MRVRGLTPMIATDRLDETEAFYGALGLSLVYSSSRSIQLDWPGAPSVRIGFFEAGPESRAALRGNGLVLVLEVADPEIAAAQLRGRGFAVETRRGEEPWDAERHAVVDPNGVVVEFAGRPALAIARPRERELA